MARRVNSYTINGTNIIIRPGDCVWLRSPKSVRFPFVARVEKFRVDRRNNVRVLVLWYYRPQDTKEGRKRFHGIKELFSSIHCDWQNACTISEKCKVHSLDDYMNLGKITTQDYFSRFEYNPYTKKFASNYFIPVYCKCEMPYNPDQLMVQCDECDNWYHPSCMDITNEEATELEKFFCLKCSSV